MDLQLSLSDSKLIQRLDRTFLAHMGKLILRQRIEITY